MKADHILQADLLDIIFENRNKQYGAYVLRKEYDHRLYKALWIIFLIMACLSVFSLLYKPAPIGKPFNAEEIVISQAKPAEPKARELPAAPPPAKQSNTSASNIVFADSSDRTVDSLPLTNEPYLPAKPGIAAGPVFIGDTFTVQPAPPMITTQVTRNRDEPVGVVDVMPEFPGGLKELRKFLEKNLKEADQLQELKEGEVASVKITFIVGFDGKLKGFNVTEDGGNVFNNEVIRVLKKMPDWKPGIAKGENVSVYYTIPVKFVAQ